MKIDMIKLTLAPLSTITILTAIGTAFTTPAQAQKAEEKFNGFTAGVQAGWERRSIDETVLPGTLDVRLSDKSDGFAYGGFVGYDHQFDNIVIGVEAGFSPNGKTLNAAVPGGGSIELDSKWSADLSVRAGVTITPQLLAYGRVGYGINRYRVRGFTAGSAAPAASDSATGEGVILGGGLEYALNRNMSLRAEYRRKEFDGSLSSDQVLSGVTFRF